MKEIRKSENGKTESTTGNKIVAVVIIALMLLCIGTDTAEVGAMIPMGIAAIVLILSRKNLLM